MLLQKGLKLSVGMLSVMLLFGCASAVFPDFEDDTDIVISDGGKVEIRKVEEKGVLVSDKDNAAYDDEDKGVTLEKAEKAEPAAVVEVKKEDIVPAEDKIEEDSETKEETKKDKGDRQPEDNVKIVDSKAETNDSAMIDKAPSMHYLAATIYFEDGGAVVDSSYYAVLRKIAKLVKENDASVTVYGFASSRTRDTDPATHKLINFNVSAKRAENTVKALRRAGVPANKIVMQALSDSMPMYQEVMPAGERLNRRAEIYLTY